MTRFSSFSVDNLVKNGIIGDSAVRFLLRSPIHGLLSERIMLITFIGKKSQRRYTTPVRYVRAGTVVRCFTSTENSWWRNLRGGADVVLRIEGKDEKFEAAPIESDPEKIREALLHYLRVHPKAAGYHRIGLDMNGTPIAEDLDRASENTIVVEAQASPCRSAEDHG